MKAEESVVVLGLDVGSRLKNAGVAAGHLAAGGLVIDEVASGATPALPGRTTDSAIGPVADWISARVPQSGRVILAIDAPLGWPTSLSAGLADHRAGQRIPAFDGPNRLWRRVTDTRIHARFGKLPLEVGANYIARTAWTALEILDRVRAQTGRAFRVPLRPDDLDCGAIETYPAATLRAVLGQAPGSYKGSGPETRERLLGQLADAFSVTPAAHEAALRVDHAFDAMVCVLAGADFALGRVPPVPPEHEEDAMQEGWIHVRDAP